MKKAGFILLSTLLFAFSGKAQLTFIDSTKNEIGININPLLDPLGIPSNTDYMTLQFKHHYTNVSLRLGLTGINTSSYDKTSPQYQFKFTDSSTVINKYYDTKNTVRFNIGLEQQQMFKNKWKFFYGFDLLGGFANKAYRLEHNVYGLGADSIFAPNHHSSDSVTTSTDQILFGAAFVAGFDCFFSKRISAGIQGYFPISYEYQTGNIRNKSSNLTFDQTFSILLKMHF